VAVTVRRDELRAAFHGLDSEQPSYTAVVKREVSDQLDSDLESGKIHAHTTESVGSVAVLYHPQWEESAEAVLCSFAVDITGQAEVLEMDSAARLWGDKAAQGKQEEREEQQAEYAEADASLQAELSAAAASAAAHFLA
jgi:hypothetical protein